MSAVVCLLIMADAVVRGARLKIGIMSYSYIPVTSVRTHVSCRVLVDHG